MATKAFYRAKRSHMRPLRNVYERAIRALESGVPIGRGHPWQLPPQPDDTERRLPDWQRHEWTMNVASALKDCPPAGWGSRRQAINEIKTQVIPFERLLKKFLKLHPDVVWRIPHNPFAETLWAPTMFAKRQEELMRTKKMKEEDAYKQVVAEGGGGGDWNGIWHTLEHDKLRGALKKEVAGQGDPQERKESGHSLLKAYTKAQYQDARWGIYKNLYGMDLNSKRTSREKEKVLDAKLDASSKQDFVNDILDLGVLFKVRAIAEKRAEQARREKLFGHVNKGGSDASAADKKL